MKKTQGFTLIELMISLVIIGLIMAYALPAYNQQVIRSKRTEAQNTLVEIAAIQEKHNAVYNQYATTLGGTLGSSALGLTGRYIQTADYQYTMNTNPAGLWTLTANARGNTQINDNFSTNCTTLTLNAVGSKTPLACWQ